MDTFSTSARAVNPAIMLEDSSVVDYESTDEIDASERQVNWTNVMAEGRYHSPSVYEKVEVLMLCWEEHSRDFDTTKEVTELSAVFEKGFGYHVTIQRLDAKRDTRLQIQVNRIVANFVHDHDGPNTLLIVQTSPNDPRDATKRARNRVVWNKTEELLRPAAADVLEIFDCCYAGTLGLTRGENRRFEYLAATKDQKTTAVPGPKSFTSALIFALEALREQKHKGRFATDELLRKIKTDAPHFPKDQNPELSDRDNNSLSGGRIMLHPLRPDRGDDDKSYETSPSELADGHIVTLHFDFGGKPLGSNLETLGRKFNEIFERNTLGVQRVRWGGVRPSVFARATRRFVASRKRKAIGTKRAPAHMKHMPSGMSCCTKKLDKGLPSPQTSVLDTQDSLDTESSSPLLGSSAPNSDRERAS
ncbi:MAG: hypothetical protein LQ348_002067 [Seirophora lacunosa]|nr:MAG: hypothetical protein LQ344_007671 [Seirophora lacunosa]KAI4198141.1 MAG: hypothetical protein LQ348_002067 [Seirophora lacunosa]